MSTSNAVPGVRPVPSSASGISALESFAECGSFLGHGRLQFVADEIVRRAAVAREHFAREREVRLGAARLHVVENHRHAVARRFAEAHVARDDGVEHLLLEELAHVARDLLPQVRPLVVHRQQHALDVEGRVEHGAHAPERADEIGEALEREVLAVQRNQHRVGGDERVEREQAERRRAVDEDVVEAVAERRDDAAQARFAREHRDQFDLGAGEVAVGGDRRTGPRRSWAGRRRTASPMSSVMSAS